jgi:putative heme-binding domain-containing protein
MERGGKFLICRVSRQIRNVPPRCRRGLHETDPRCPRGDGRGVAAGAGRRRGGVEPRRRPAGPRAAGQSQGGQVGPELSKIGAIRTGSDLLVSVVFPSVNFVRGYEPYVVTTRSGKVHPAGLLKRQTADALYLVTGDRAEIRIPRADVESVEASKVSIMPQGLDARLSWGKLADLLAYLQSLR